MFSIHPRRQLASMSYCLKGQVLSTALAPLKLVSINTPERYCHSHPQPVLLVQLQNRMLLWLRLQVSALLWFLNRIQPSNSVAVGLDEAMSQPPKISPAPASPPDWQPRSADTAPRLFVLEGSQPISPPHPDAVAASPAMKVAPDLMPLPLRPVAQLAASPRCVLPSQDGPRLP